MLLPRLLLRRTTSTIARSTPRQCVKLAASTTQQRFFAAAAPPVEGAELNRTPLDALHRRNGGKMVPFAGYSMPVLYEGVGVGDSHRFVREKSGLFDVSHMVQRRFVALSCAVYCALKSLSFSFLWIVGELVTVVKLVKLKQLLQLKHKQLK
jgi:aminomethyltransferase